VDVTFGWDRPTFPAYPGDPNAFQSFAVDPVGILLQVTDYAGATASAVGIVTFTQLQSNESRAGCPPQPPGISALSAVSLVSKRSYVTVPAATPKTTKLATKLACAGQMICAGELSIATAAPGAAASAAASTPTVLARTFFSIMPHATRKVVAPLTTAGVALLRRLRRGASLRARLTITNVGPTGSTLVRSSTIVIKRR